MAKNSVRASIVTLGGFRPTRRPSATHFGFAPLVAPGEPWPVANDGTNLFFICQLNLTEAPFVPDIVRDVALITFFVSSDTGRLGEENGDGWVLRAYATIESLVPLAIPVGCTFVRGFECSWQEIVDRRKYDEAAHRTKIGGYASEIQSAPWWDERGHPSKPAFCLQIDSEEKIALAWGDRGTVYVARGTAPGCESQWFLDWQCY